jgi:MFS family permease
VYAITVAARAVRNAAYGSLAVVFALLLAREGLGPATVGVVLTLALVMGAVFSAATPWLERRAGRRGTLVGAALVMASTGALLAIDPRPLTFFLAALLGTVSPGGQEVGPFAALEQAAIADHEQDGSTVRRFARYNVIGAFGAGLGALAAGVVPIASIPLGYCAAGMILAALYLFYPSGSRPAEAPLPSRRAARRLGPAEQLTILFGVDALAGGFVVQSFIAYWLTLRFGVGAQSLGWLFFGTNTLAALSFLAAAPIAERIGLLETMVFTHLPSNVLLLAVPLMPTFPLAAAVLLARFALSQMDVPTRQAFTMAVVPAAERARAAGLTNAVRPAAAAVAPVLAGLAVQGSALGLPFYLAGGLKIAYDVAVFVLFRDVRSTREPAAHRREEKEK